MCHLSLARIRHNGACKMRRASAATDAEDLSPLEKSVFEELNFARTQPKELAKHLLAMRPHFDGKIMKLPGREAAVQNRRAWRLLTRRSSTFRPLLHSHRSRGSRQACRGRLEIT